MKIGSYVFAQNKSSDKKWMWAVFNTDLTEERGLVYKELMREGKFSFKIINFFGLDFNEKESKKMWVGPFDTREEMFKILVKAYNKFLIDYIVVLEETHKEKIDKMIDKAVTEITDAKVGDVVILDKRGGSPH